MGRRKKSWWGNHWDEVMLIGGITFAILLLMKANGVF